MNLIPITVRLEEETINRIAEAVNYKNHLNYLTPSKGNPIDYDIEDFITACVNSKLNEMFNYMELIDYGELGYQGKLKNRIGEFMKKVGLNQKQLSDIAGVSRSSLNLFVHNNQQPSLETFIRIWVAFKCPPIHELVYKEDL